jgi:hypothetical protein
MFPEDENEGFKMPKEAKAKAGYYSTILCMYTCRRHGGK